MIINYRVMLTEVPLLLSYFKEPWIFRTDFRIIVLVTNFVKIPPVETDLFNADRARERQGEGKRQAEANILLLQFANAPKVYITLKTSGDFSRYSNKLFVLITETECAYCAVRTEDTHTQLRVVYWMK
jgi:hypothetical protein